MQPIYENVENSAFEYVFDAISINSICTNINGCCEDTGNMLNELPIPSQPISTTNTSYQTRSTKPRKFAGQRTKTFSVKFNEAPSVVSKAAANVRKIWRQYKDYQLNRFDDDSQHSTPKKIRKISSMIRRSMRLTSNVSNASSKNNEDKINVQNVITPSMTVDTNSTSSSTGIKHNLSDEDKSDKNIIFEKPNCQSTPKSRSSSFTSNYSIPSISNKSQSYDSQRINNDEELEEVVGDVEHQRPCCLCCKKDVTPICPPIDLQSHSHKNSISCSQSSSGNSERFPLNEDATFSSIDSGVSNRHHVLKENFPKKANLHFPMFPAQFYKSERIRRTVQISKNSLANVKQDKSLNNNNHDQINNDTYLNTFDVGYNRFSQRLQKYEKIHQNWLNVMEARKIKSSTNSISTALPRLQSLSSLHKAMMMEAEKSPNLKCRTTKKMKRRSKSSNQTSFHDSTKFSMKNSTPKGKISVNRDHLAKIHRLINYYATSLTPADQKKPVTKRIPSFITPSKGIVAFYQM
ncbi:hypothetical protein SNEBB_010084 [Seison nebaliae]|nr:hypothetical protein SNEBB_010084 [Seison nebaliae]